MCQLDGGDQTDFSILVYSDECRATSGEPDD